jgi:predicted PhzF superfamily epimerase YddE/YHI9
MVLNWEAHVSLRYHTVDVFTRTRFGGNPLAVVIDADGLTRVQLFREQLRIATV